MEIAQKRRQREVEEWMKKEEEGLRMEFENVDDKTKFEFVYRSSSVILLACDIMKMIRSVVVESERSKVEHFGVSDKDVKMKRLTDNMRKFTESVDGAFVHAVGRTLLRHLEEYRESVMRSISAECGKLAGKFDANIQKLYGTTDENMSSLIGYCLLVNELADMGERLSAEETARMNKFHEEHDTVIRYSNSLTVMLAGEIRKLIGTLLLFLGFNASDNIWSANVKKCVKALEAKVNAIDYEAISKSLTMKHTKQLLQHCGIQPNNIGN